MASYVLLASKLERAVRALLILQGKTLDSFQFAANGDTFISNDSRTRTVIPNRTVQVSTTHPIRSSRPEGILHFQIQHHIESALQPGDEGNQEVRRMEADELLGQTLTTFSISDFTNDHELRKLADAITAAGRWLATPSNDSSDTAAAEIVRRNSDMLAFRVDWVRFADPFHTRGHVEHDSALWAEVLNFEASVSQATN